MAEARRRLEWDQTAALMMMLHNVNTVKESDLVGPDHYHPCPEKRPAADRVIRGDFKDFRALVLPGP